jgi:hypothetical protein
LFYGLLTERYPPGRDDNLGSFCSKPQRNSFPNPAAAASHNRDFVSESLHGFPL